MSKLRMILVLAVVAGGLGCSGVGQKLMEMSGLEIQTGAEASRPADFPLPALMADPRHVGERELRRGWRRPPSSTT